MYYTYINCRNITGETDYSIQLRLIVSHFIMVLDENIKIIRGRFESLKSLTENYYSKLAVVI